MIGPALLLFAVLSGDAPYQQPQLAAAGDAVAVAFGSQSRVLVAVSRDGGQKFGQPVEVAAVPSLALGRHRGPRIAYSGRDLVVSAIVGRMRGEPGGAGGNLKAWRSTDGGTTWSGPAAVNDVPDSAREGLHAIAAGPDGAVFAAWLDLRENRTKLFGSVSRDGGRSWSKNRLIYESPEGTICECCHPSVAIGKDGRIAVIFRNSLGGARDLYLTVSADGGATFTPAQKLGEGTWPLKACPMDGGGLAFESSGAIASAWRRGSELFRATPGEPEHRVGAGKDVALAPGGLILWTSPEGVRALSPQAAEAEILDSAGAYPQAIALPGGGHLAAWERGGTLQFRRF